MDVSVGNDILIDIIQSTKVGDMFKLDIKLTESSDKVTVPRILKKRGLNAIKEELDATKTLSQWPCPNFLSLEKKAFDSFTLVLPTIRFYEVSANCSAPYVKCTVNFDKKEQQELV
jgi:hypothetical protein